MLRALVLAVLLAAAAGTHSLAADPLDDLASYMLVWSEGKRTGDAVWAWFGDLNGDGVMDHRDAARAVENLLSGVVGTLEKVPPGTGFDWPYYLYLPVSVPPGTSTRLLVAPNNTGTCSDDQAVHDEAARRQADGLSILAERMRTPLLVPTFPRPYSNWQVYTHALDRDTLLTTLPGLRRLDLQLIAMIEHARTRLQAAGINVAARVLMSGFSASGMFTNRFTALHPDRVQAAAIGSPGGWPIAPVASWQGDGLRYPVGIADLQDLVGAPFDAQTFKAVPLHFYIGDQDTNDSVPYSDGYDAQDRDLVNRLFGTTPVARWPHAQAVYESAQCNAEFLTYPGVGHQVTQEIMLDIVLFLAGHM